jgi:hypothetical protein
MSGSLLCPHCGFYPDNPACAIGCPGRMDFTTDKPCEAGTKVDYSGPTPRIVMCNSVPTGRYRMVRLGMEARLCAECGPKMEARGDVIPWRRRVRRPRPSASDDSP